MRANAGNRLRKLWVTGVALLMVVAGCATGADPGAGDAPEPEPTATAAPVLVAPSGEVPFDRPVTLRLEHGTFEKVILQSDANQSLDGTIADDRESWTSTTPPVPGAGYRIQADAADEVGDPVPLTGSFTVAPVPDSKRLTLTLQPGDGDVVGIGAPIVVRFDQQVSERAAVEQAMHLASNPQVVGSWHWLSSTEVHFRPKELWPAGARVAVFFDLNGVHAGEDLWGGRSYSWEFTIGPAQVGSIDAAAHSMTVRVDGKRVATWDASLGRPEFATRNGTYIVLWKDRIKRMTSCGADITCNKNSPEYYDLDVHWSVRLTWSGTFVHSAPWSEGAQGSANVSHGCINLSDAHGKAFFELVRYGDVVTVKNSTRGAGDLVARGDPGMVDWNQAWSDYVSGSALGRQVTTDPLTG